MTRTPDVVGQIHALGEEIRALAALLARAESDAEAGPVAAALDDAASSLGFASVVVAARADDLRQAQQRFNQQPTTRRAARTPEGR